MCNRHCFRTRVYGDDVGSNSSRNSNIDFIDVGAVCWIGVSFEFRTRRRVAIRIGDDASSSNDAVFCNARNIGYRINDVILRHDYDWHNWSLFVFVRGTMVVVFDFVVVASLDLMEHREHECIAALRTSLIQQPTSANLSYNRRVCLRRPNILFTRKQQLGINANDIGDESLFFSYNFIRRFWNVYTTIWNYYSNYNGRGDYC